MCALDERVVSWIHHCATVSVPSPLSSTSSYVKEVMHENRSELQENVRGDVGFETLDAGEDSAKRRFLRHKVNFGTGRGTLSLLNTPANIGSSQVRGICQDHL